MSERDLCRLSFQMVYAMTLNVCLHASLNLSLHNMHIHITVLLNNILTNHMHIIILLPNAYSCNHSDVLLYVQEGGKNEYK